ncbi:hypothetical protein PIB30_047341 [Stylosanthes scabra]|uniref:Uncharacterized protein n=1 Tax=Stylosanthes scabra TaxID=79078 RepID=A0ABU6SHP2_9FABA|nr:hypothetical protein [Stylosanthes scabra]
MVLLTGRREIMVKDGRIVTDLGHGAGKVVRMMGRAGAKKVEVLSNGQAGAQVMAVQLVAVGITMSLKMALAGLPKETMGAFVAEEIVVGLVAEVDQTGKVLVADGDQREDLEAEAAEGVTNLEVGAVEGILVGMVLLTGRREIMVKDGRIVTDLGHGAGKVVRRMGRAGAEKVEVLSNGQAGAQVMAVQLVAVGITMSLKALAGLPKETTGLVGKSLLLLKRPMFRRVAGTRDLTPKIGVNPMLQRRVSPLSGVNAMLKRRVSPLAGVNPVLQIRASHLAGVNPVLMRRDNHLVGINQEMEAHGARKVTAVPRDGNYLLTDTRITSSGISSSVIS